MQGSSHSGTLSVVVADDDPFARRAIVEALRADGVDVLAEAHNGAEAVRLCVEHRPDVLLLDVVMPGTDGIGATRRVTEQLPDQVVVLLTSSDDDDFGMLGLRAGAAGFLTKDLDLDVLSRALDGARAGEAVVSRRFGMRLVEYVRRTSDPRELRPIKGPLTSREWQVMTLIAERKTTDQIADALVVSPETVRSHVKHILRKLDVRSREEAIEIAQRLQGSRPPKPAA